MGAMRNRELLAQVERHIADSKNHIACQREVIAKRASERS
jgi:hypothetical protein